MSLFRENNTSGLGDPIEIDEGHAMNGKLDMQWIFYHTIIFWLILILVIEWRIPCCMISRMKQVTREDNKEFFSANTPGEEDEVKVDDVDNSESSEVAHIIGEGDNL